jgi:hypothetical protein
LIELYEIILNSFSARKDCKPTIQIFGMLNENNLIVFTEDLDQTSDYEHFRIVVCQFQIRSSLLLDLLIKFKNNGQ